MTTKATAAPGDCYAKALPDEPLFVLLARDPSAPQLVKVWADIREAAIGAGSRPEADRTAVAEARTLADAMALWRDENDGRWRSRGNGRLPDAYVSREAVAAFMERYAERLVAGPAVREFGAPINRNRHDPEEAQAVRNVIRALAQAVRAGVDQAETDWPLTEQAA